MLTLCWTIYFRQSKKTKKTKKQKELRTTGAKHGLEPQGLGLASARCRRLPCLALPLEHVSASCARMVRTLPSREANPKPSRVSKFGLLARGANRENAAAQETKEPKTTVQVDLGARSYPIYIGPGLLANGDMLCKHTWHYRTRSDRETIAPYYLARTVKSLSSTGEIRVEVVVLPDGEEYKTVEVLMKIYDKALESKLIVKQLLLLSAAASSAT